MKFQFRLQRMLELMELQEVAKKNEVLTQRQKIDALNRVIRGLKETTLELFGNQKTKSVNWLQYAMEKIQFNQVKTKAMEVQLRQEDEVLRNLRFDLHKITQKKEALEALKEKKRIEFQLKEQKKEQKEMEEIFRMKRYGNQ